MKKLTFNAKMIIYLCVTATFLLSIFFSISYSFLSESEEGWGVCSWIAWSAFFVLLCAAIMVISLLIGCIDLHPKSNAKDDLAKAKWLRAQDICTYSSLAYTLLSSLTLNVVWLARDDSGAELGCLLYDMLMACISISIFMIGFVTKHPEYMLDGMGAQMSARNTMSYEDTDMNWLFGDSNDEPDPWSHPWRDQSYAEQCRERRWRQTDNEDFVKGGGGDPHDHFDWEDIEDAEGNGII